MRKLLIIGIFVSWLMFAVPSGAQSVGPIFSAPVSGGIGAVTSPSLVTKPLMPRMAPELALATYQHRMQQQAALLASYSNTTRMEAELSDGAQKAEYELKRHYDAPKSLTYTPVRFSGDGFVKSNVFLRLLQSEVEHVAKQQNEQTAISEQNYKFTLKGAEEVDGHSCYVYQVKPRKKRVGLFKGRIFIDAHTAAMRRAEGSFVKSPSWWVKKIEFVQDFDEIGGFNLPVKLYSVSKARVIGRAVVSIFHRDYQTVAAGSAAASETLGGGAKAD